MFLPPPKISYAEPVHSSWTGLFLYPLCKQVLIIFYRQGFALVFALNAAETFATMQDFWDQVVEVKQTDKVPIVLIGRAKQPW